MKNIENLRKQYNNIEIPTELDNIINTAIDKKPNIFSAYFRKAGIVAASIIVIFTSAVNISPAFAQSMSNIPVVSSMVKLVNFKTYTAENGNMEANINVAKVEGLSNKELENELNSKFIEEGQKEYSNFLKEMKELKGDAHNSVGTSYEVKTDNDSIYSIVYSKYETAGSSDIQYKAYTIDKKNQAVVTLNSLFKDNSYIDIISNNIKEQMREQMKTDNSKVYFIDSSDDTGDNFDKIKADQTFYINSDGNIVILFNKYDVAPGYMGAPEFVIPTDVVSNILLNRGLVK